MRWSLLVAAVLACSACARVEGTGRSQLLLTSVAEENRLGAEAYAEVKAGEKPCADAATVAFVERVGRRLAAVAPARGFQYEFTTLHSDTVNAFCLPGGKVAIYTGILPWCVNEAGLAAVMGHEIGHAIARHGGERMSQGMVAQLGGGALEVLLEAKGIQPTNRNLVLGAAGALAQVGVILPYSRSHELEADYLGLTYMAKAGYDPAQAVAFWSRFAELTGGTPGFLSTHPASEDRARRLQACMAEAQALYQAAPVKSGAGEPVPAAFRQRPAGKG
jgi:predicted Zn-dependent protease